MASGGRSDSGASSSGSRGKGGNGRVSGARRGGTNLKARSSRIGKVTVKNGVRYTRSGPHSLASSKRAQRERRLAGIERARQARIKDIGV